MTLHVVAESFNYIFTWLRDEVQRRGGDPYSFEAMMNVSLFNSFLDAHPDTVLVELQLGAEPKTVEYSPTRVTNATVVFANNGSTVAMVSSQSRLSAVLGSKRVVFAAQIIVPAGAALTFPWLLSTWKMKSRSKQQGSTTVLNAKRRSQSAKSQVSKFLLPRRTFNYSAETASWTRL